MTSIAVEFAEEYDNASQAADEAERAAKEAAEASANAGRNAGRARAAVDEIERRIPVRAMRPGKAEVSGLVVLVKGTDSKGQPENIHYSRLVAVVVKDGAKVRENDLIGWH